MKITEIVHKKISDVNSLPRFDMLKKPTKAPWYLQVLAWALSFPETFAVKSKIIKTNMKGLKGPYVLLCNHNSFLDFKVATKAIFPRKSNYVVAVDGFINREGLLRSVGGIGKRKFISDTSIVRNVKYSLEKLNQICQIYPEARYSLVGTTAIIPESLAKFVKVLKYPVVTLISHGHHLRQPVWNLKKRRVKTKSQLTQIITKEDILNLSVSEIDNQIQEAFKYDDYKYQVDQGIKIKYKNRAKNLHNILYMCPNCHSEFTMKSDGSRIWCEKCKEIHEMDVFGQLHNLYNETKFTHIPDWYEWQREQVRQEILSGNYNVELEVDVDSLPNSTGYYRLGRGVLKHDEEGFELLVKQEDETLHIKKKVLENYSLHVEYDYFGRGNGISFSTINDTYYIYPVDQKYSVTKLHFAVEELYKIENQKFSKAKNRLNIESN